MTWEEALTIVIERTSVKRYETLCADDWHDHEVWRAEMLRMAQEPPDAAFQHMQHYPPIQQQAQNLFRSALGWARSGFKLAPRDVRQQRLAECVVCEWYDAENKRCKKCGCVNGAKVWVASDSCPLEPPRWTAIK